MKNFFVAILLVFAFASVASAFGYAGGEGSEYATKADLQGIRNDLRQIKKDVRGNSGQIRRLKGRADLSDQKFDNLGGRMLQREADSRSQWEAIMLLLVSVASVGIALVFFCLWHSRRHAPHSPRVP